MTRDFAKFEQLIYTYKEPIYSILLRMTEQEEAVRLLKGAFVKVYEEMPHYDGRMSRKSWLYRLVIQYWSEHKAGHGSSRLVKTGREQQLECLIANLPERSRLLFLLRYGGDCSYKEIADITQMSIDEVREKLDVIKQQMRNEVREARE